MRLGTLLRSARSTPTAHSTAIDNQSISFLPAIASTSTRIQAETSPLFAGPPKFRARHGAHDFAAATLFFATLVRAVPPQHFSMPRRGAQAGHGLSPWLQAPGRGQLQGSQHFSSHIPADRAALQPPQERAHGSLRAAESPERLHAPMGEGGGVCALQGCKPSGAPIFLAVWRLHGRRGTGSVGYVVTVGDQQSLPAECQRSNFAIHFLRKRILQWPGE